MYNPEIKNFVKSAFEEIKKARSVNCLQKILDDFEFQKNKISVETYPKIRFKISAQEIQQLVAANILDQNYQFNSEVSFEESHVVTKLLYALAWKNGDLKKINHIIKGILSTEDEELQVTESLVFHQFGRHLTKKSNEPIIDQHVIRAFCVYKNYEKIKIIEKGHIKYINEYKNWLVSEEISPELKSENDYVYFIDQILFAVGKTVKSMNK
ncbi:hypothetical protein [Epilithonimonas arachidiradicis]|uniref:Uncharacterized protein n=1 Tax=Epilithonimonas arachidiradicis TaxID=1617282 RepID=A0A420CMN8_9FLAO|nr:hypothetical protein [Epilithonimonas arachidiradicis]RKE79667.1 hypothetical protein BXY58_3031 [Epilithonimonas arachidiradicis]GGG52682.1 hypothetical protein GCM10007332_12980 [Epilithonimonas arachidiradicis]